jgi:hypothetical protein
MSTNSTLQAAKNVAEARAHVHNIVLLLEEKMLLWLPWKPMPWRLP